MNIENIGWAVFAIVIIGVFTALIRATLWNKHPIDDDTFEFDFQDNDGNFYRAVEHRGQKILLRIPDEVEVFLDSNRADRSATINSAERKAKMGLLEKVVINGAIGYLAKGKEIRKTVKEQNKRNER